MAAMLSEQCFYFVLKIRSLLLAKSQIIVFVHITAVPERLEYLPLLLDAQALRHRIGQECRLRTREQRLVVLIHVARLLSLLPQRHRVFSTKRLRQQFPLISLPFWGGLGRGLGSGVGSQLKKL